MNGEGWLDLSLACAGFVAVSTAFLLLAWGVTRLLSRHSAATRHLVWSVAFVAALVTPIAGLLLPSHPIPVVRIAAEAAPVETLNAVELTLPMSDRPAVTELPPVDPAKPRLPAVVGLWVFGAVLAGAEALVALIALCLLRRRAVAPAVDVTHLADRAGLERNWELRVAAGPYPPTAMTWGIRRPVVMLPEVALAWPQERLEAVVLHELAHVRRRDCASQLVAVATCALYWFNPVVWLCARAMRAEAEGAADDAVLRSGVTPSVYAEALLGIAAALGRRRQPFAAVGVPIMKRSKIERRIEAILDPRARRRGATLTETLVAATLGIATLFPLATLRPAVVQSPPPALLAPTAPVAVRPAKAVIAPQAISRPGKAKKLKHSSAKRHSHRPTANSVPVYVVSVPAYVVSAAPKPAPAAPRPSINLRAVTAPHAVSGLRWVPSVAPRTVDIALSTPSAIASVAPQVTSPSSAQATSNLSARLASSITFTTSPIQTHAAVTTSAPLATNLANSISLVRAQADARPATLSAQLELVQAARAKKGTESAQLAGSGLRIETALAAKAAAEQRLTVQQLQGLKVKLLNQKLAVEQLSLAKSQFDATALQRAAAEQRLTVEKLQSLRLHRMSGKLGKTELEIAKTRLTIARAQLKLAKQLAELHRKK
ncbi:M56 family metallopeptidase [Fimbriimonas ginsengisoli]|uniref:TonB family protein n=1 Tax=Fimbriimonas ginsengisoli Gsoil 348 TaxID=661478 RepID=A0A068NNH7_FIMGI|nr:M56 family metallopeptidase [Fimbriimonas ginsengisoli]AIE84315.1 TonB family protein [Fimbriimonas ginsengisoli Gsoil 348]